MTNKLAAVLLLATLPLMGVACAPGTQDPDSETVSGADEDTASQAEGLSGSLAVGTKLVSVSGVNLRTGPSTGYKVLHTVPQGATVEVVQSAPSGSWYKIKHSGTVGWSHGAYYNLAPGQSGTTDPPPPGSSNSKRDQAIARAKSAMGFSYWWGHGRFKDSGVTSSTKGSCSGSCPSCSHSGSYGGDCSGLVAKVWQVPSSNTDMSADSHPYSTADFVKSASNWSLISRSSVQKADSLVYRDGGKGHVFVYSHGDAWGSMYSYECRGCSAGCIEGYRTASSAYKAIRRAGY